MANRQQRALIAAETVSITRFGGYTAPSGAMVSIGDSVRRAVESTVTISPQGTKSLRSRADEGLARRNFNTVIEVCNEGTFTAARRLVERFGSERVAALNFASAKNPGGGFLSGAQAQEECLARASALHACLEPQRAYYDANRAYSSSLYTDHMIVSPQVPVFRDEEERLMEHPWEVTIITSPAPNAGAIAKNDPQLLDSVEPTFRRRVEHILSAACLFDQAALVLGAWGCGAFRNDPNMVARRFAEFLLADGAFARAFEHITFAVLDRDGTNFAAFENVFRTAK